MKAVLLYKRTNLIFVIPFLSGGLAFVAGGIILYLSGVDPVEAYELMLKGSFGTKRAIAETLVKTIPLLTAGLAVAVAFKCKLWNIGAEGQLYMGALGGLLVGISFIGSVPVISVILVMFAGFGLGALFSMIPAVLKVKLGVSEIIVTVLLNFVALLFISYLLQGPIKAPGFLPYSPDIFPESELPILLPTTRLHAGIIIAALAAVAVYLFLWKTKLGFEIKSVGANIQARSLRRNEYSKKCLCDNGNKRWVSWPCWCDVSIRCTTSPYRGAFAWIWFYRCHNSIAWQATPFRCLSSCVLFCGAVNRI